MRYTGPRNRIARREGIDLGLKTPGSKSHANLLKRINVFPGQQGARKRRKISDHAKQLREKQKLRYLFMVSERQLKKYFKEAVTKKGNTALYLGKFLEKRLDNLIYRAGLVPTRASARQLVSHGHIKVNDKVISIPSFQAKKGDIITFSKDNVIKIPYIEKMLQNKDVIMPSWIERKATICKMVYEPTSEEISKQISLRLVIEHYSR
ncbi:30S ribosomal protein S4 [Candidatus Roizmanbacteria bacterium RIFCSPLOWO2_01_FULL_37_13]|uniref:Small ribosomal subunit protein uS4 n=1 Tax=Candidatus Roizmanbacteria bacterium RIFCSPHIGHO2_02_FULL_38_11 TaxID=1802039 RepID=A0A1F7H2K1_9BACT|nr:MAG: 30S ribosomal protein S4 [Candidatus Roizmanbacteria bacterium RIFCSPHIGHO2_02_FULL_38_11]OGK40936.1 MAG: 30S ribosomal protein S4 [Candidatus Roizmanbacteria bacterium RIFCSPLOWO2_01_FULL_37_13]